MANRLAIDMGFNMDPSVLTGTVALPKIEIELRRQIYWALYCHDKLSASYTGRVCTLLVGHLAPLHAPCTHLWDDANIKYRTLKVPSTSPIQSAP